MADQLKVDIVAPGDRVFRGQASAVRAPGVEGSFSVLRGHAPMIAAFGVGPLVVTTDDASEYADMSGGGRIVFATSGGFVEVIDDTVTVLAETAEAASAIDTDRARRAEERARRRLETGGADLDRARAESALDRARNRLRVAMGEMASR
jgi:F-type H+-transporting ATPase subunit epsilon